MKNLLLIGNWKNYIPSWKEAVRVAKQYPDSTKYTTVVVCPSDVYVGKVVWEFPGKVHKGLQNIEVFKGGGVVGSTNLAMASAVGARYVILGHSWRRKNTNETSVVVNTKLHEVLRSADKHQGFVPIVCVGESSREEGYLEVLETQIKETFRGLSRQQLDLVIVAYEPVWAVGATEPATAEQVRKIDLFIKQVLMKMTNDRSVGRLRVVYGGSVHADMDIESFLKESGVDGFLVGRASVDATQFTTIRCKMDSFAKNS